nr:hypothetical protein [Tanacetum cinerariifolium]
MPALEDITFSNDEEDVGIQEHFDADNAREGNVPQYVLFPLWSSGSKDPQNTDDDATFEVKEPEFEVKKPESAVHVSPCNSTKTKKHDDKTTRETKSKSPVELSTGFRNLKDAINFDEFGDVLMRIGPRTAIELAIVDHGKVMTFYGEIVSKVNLNDSSLRSGCYSLVVSPHGLIVGHGKR